MSRVVTYNATLHAREDVTPELTLFHVKPDHEVPDFAPGQYVALGLTGSAPRHDQYPPEEETPAQDKIIQRAYSIGSSPHEKNYIEFYIALLQQGALTARLSALKAGDRLYIAPKITGTFTLKEVQEGKNLIFVATGTGIAPFMSMLRTPESWKEGRSITLLHGVRYSQDLAYREELKKLAQENPNFRYLPFVSRGEVSEDMEKGYVQRVFTENLISFSSENESVFLCGNPAMIDDVVKVLTELGFREHTRKVPGNIHLERYW